MGCPCYWGCGTTPNKVVWGVLLGMVVLGGALIVAGGVGGKQCFSDYNVCMKELQDSDRCGDYYKAVCKLDRWIGLVASGAILLIVVVPLMTSYFCCCASKPSEVSPGVVVVAAAVPPPGYVQAYPVAYPPPAAYPAPPAAYPPPPAAYPPPPA